VSLLTPLAGAFLVISVVLLAVKIWALVDAIIRPEHAFVAAGKQTKGFWLVILALAVVLGWIGLFSIIGLVAALVYLVDVRPRVREIRRGSSGGSGPYGPW
jgi:hypothetical protein